MSDFKSLRQQMVENHIYARGVRDEKLLTAMSNVRRELFVSPELRNIAYDDRPLPIAAGQTISQPYIVAYMIEALALKGGERVLEIGAGSGYAAAVIAEIADDVYAIERIAQLATQAAQNLIFAGYNNVHIKHDDGTQGWLEKAPFDAILVSAGAPSIPEPLLAQLKIGGRMVVPIGANKIVQELVRITRVSEDEYEREDMADVRFVPLIGKNGWEEDLEQAQQSSPRVTQSRPITSASLASLIVAGSSSFTNIEEADLDPLIERIGDSQVVLIGEASHGTSEFYKMRAKITKKLIKERGFNIVALEADWPDAARIDNYVRHFDVPVSEWTSFARFPTWMWRNEETREFVDWLHIHNEKTDASDRVGVYGLDIYSLYTSVREVIKYLEEVDPELAKIARQRYSCLTPWEADPAAYGRAALMGQYQHCENDITDMLTDLLAKRQDYAQFDGARFFNAEQNAKLIASAEQYYRIMYYGSRASWNLRDTHMFSTLQRIISHQGEKSKAVVWAHNSHVGNALATEMSARGEYNIGQLCKQSYGDKCYIIGFGTYDGSVAAASEWDGPMQIKKINPAHPQSYEGLFHMTNVRGLLMPLRNAYNEQAIEGLMKPRLERAIGVIYRQENELASHYFEAKLPAQFDEYIWIDNSSAITPIKTKTLEAMPDTYPFGL